jgi:hypothetical protein
MNQDCSDVAASLVAKFGGSPVYLSISPCVPSRSTWLRRMVPAEVVGHPEAAGAVAAVTVVLGTQRLVGR